ncbi:beta-galactosidase [Haloprofundus salilacus]|uniref:beta-galactosidase n=1 Tax=Haloprofundus salilacus TaxID=2876190 RepID=UPI0031B89D24
MEVGVCYFPEHWNPSRWAVDVGQMAEGGVEYVRMGEFAWSRLEPERGEFDFAWLDEVLELLDEHVFEDADMTARVDSTVRPRAGETVRITFDEEALYLFDSRTGESVKTKTGDVDIGMRELRPE